MSSLFQSVRKQMQMEDTETQQKPKANKLLGWRRVVLALLTLMATTRSEMVMEYLISKRGTMATEDMEEKKKDLTGRKKKDPDSKIRQAIGKPLNRSQAQKKWNREVSSCAHEEEYLRHRAGKGHFWYTCLQCGGRWERLETTSSSSTQVVQTTESNYPTYLPPPRSRPDLPTQKVTVINEAQSMSAGEQLPLTNHLKARGRTSDRLTGLNPMQRSKAPVVTHGSLEGRAREMFELASDSENPIYEDVPMEFTEEEIARLNAEAREELVMGAMGTEYDFVTAMEREQILDP